MGILDNLFGNNSESHESEKKETYTEEHLEKEMEEYFSSEEEKLGITDENRSVRFEDLGEHN